MDSFENYPGTKPWTDRHGKLRWRYRKGKRTVYLDGESGQDGFDEAYQRAIAGQSPEPKVMRLGGERIAPRSFDAAWQKYQKYEEWKTAAPATRLKNSRLAKEFLNIEIAEGSGIYWRPTPLADLRRIM